MIWRCCSSSPLTHWSKRIARCCWLTAMIVARLSSSSKRRPHSRERSRPLKTISERLSRRRLSLNSLIRRRSGIWGIRSRKSKRKSKCSRKWSSRVILMLRLKRLISRGWRRKCRGLESKSDRRQRVQGPVVDHRALEVTIAHLNLTWVDLRRLLSVTRFSSRRAPNLCQKWRKQDARSGKKLSNWTGCLSKNAVASRSNASSSKRTNNTTKC